VQSGGLTNLYLDPLRHEEPFDRGMLDLVREKDGLIDWIVEHFEKRTLESQAPEQ
jgi:hypothetical protein